MSKPFEGAGILFKHPGYVKYAWLTALLNLILYVLAFYLVFHFLFPWINSLLPSHSATSFMSYLYKFLEWLMKIIAFLSLLVLSVLLFNIICFAISSPFLDGLSVSVEKDYFSFAQEPSGITDLARSCVMSVKNGIWLNCMAIFWAIILFPLNFIIPVIGFLPGMIIGAYFLGLSFLIFCAEHRNMTRKGFKASLKGRRMKVLGFGLMMYWILFVPFSAVIFIPAGIIGGTMLYNEKDVES